MSRPQTFLEMLLERAEQEPDAEYVLMGEVSLTFGAVAEKSAAIAAGLQQLGVQFGDRVAIVLPNCPEFVLAYYACSRLGAIMVPLNTYLRGSFLSYQLRDSQASVVITDHLGFEQTRAVLGELPEVPEIVLVGDGAEVARPTGVRVTPFAALQAHTAPAQLRRIEPSDISGILYTSGTTGMPKGCVVSYAYGFAIATALCERHYFERGDRLITAWPLFHNGGYVYGLGAPLVGGGSLVLEAQFSASNFIPRARETHATVFYGMGAMALAILAQPLSPDDRVNDLRFAFILPGKPELLEEFRNRFGLDDVAAEQYGQTECVPVTIGDVRGKRKRDSAGFPLPHFEVCIADEKDNPLPVGRVGEILVRPKQPGVMYSGYWNNPVASLEAIRNLWHHTGDYGRLDEDGYLYFVDRKKDAIRRRGEFISSMELEQAIVRHPDIATVAAYAVPSEMTEDDIKVWIIPAEGCTIEPQGLFDFCRKVLPYYAMPRYVEVVDSLPMNAALRALKHELKKRPNTESTWDMEKMGFVVSRDERRV
jgi:crotonobetaine/carnitine-CoA ligase